MDNEFDYNGNERRDPHQMAEAALSGRHNIGRTTSGITISSELDAAAVNSEIPLLTYGQEVDCIPNLLIIFLSFQFNFLRNFASW